MSQPEINLRVAGKAVIVKDGKVLILREALYDGGTNAGKYVLPGGKLNNNELFFDALRREVREETGLEIEIGQPVYIGEWWPVIRDVKNHIVAVFVRCQALSTNVVLSEEHDAFAWIALDDVAKYTFAPPEDEVARIALTNVQRGA